ncbi:MAG: hypothetical protein COT74_11410 [Bdellovibrionales bacterium CG10_big_fil_rev_8_21_14_0_10_45_34]|nr:MAG: hypothetical protein COT74_11410 [Bdellovibrionales bacterium CG10_big_fil_rev_8_21_14_0_10_45_34]
MIKKSNRVSTRKEIEGINVSNLTALDKFAVISRKAKLVDASSTGFLLLVDRKDIVPKALRQTLTLESIEGEPIMLTISEMDLEIDGLVTRTKFLGKGIFEVAIDFSFDAPEYWRECLLDLLPSPQR